jgi:transposase
MNLQEQLSQLTATPGLPDWLVSSLKNISDQVDAKENLHQSQMQEKESKITYQSVKIEKMAYEIAILKRLKFAASNEKLSLAIRDLFAETYDADLAAVDAETAAQQEAAIQSSETSPLAVATAPKKRASAGRAALPADLPRIEHHHEMKVCTCGACQGELQRIGEDVTEQLDVEPSKFFVHRHIRGKYACRACQTIHAEPVPPQIIDGGMTSPGLLSWIAVSKFVDHLPLYRLATIAQRGGVTLSKSSLSAWVGEIGVALQPLVDALVLHQRRRRVLHADETPIRQLDPGRGEAKRAYLWAYRSNDLDTGPPIIVFDYQISRSGQHARTFLDGWSGHLLTDDYSGYKKMYQQLGAHMPAVEELGCWAHARRKFFDLHAASQSALAAQALAHIAKLYKVESQAKEMDVAQRQVHRAQYAMPALAEFKSWLIKHRLTLAPGSATCKAFDYTLKRWHALDRYATSGHLPIDNNPVENSIRPIAIGKKNWLFTGSERAGKRAAAIQSLLGTAKLNGLDPFDWLKDTLEKLPTWPNRRIDELLPFKNN